MSLIKWAGRATGAGAYAATVVIAIALVGVCALIANVLWSEMTGIRPARNAEQLVMRSGQVVQSAIADLRGTEPDISLPPSPEPGEAVDTQKLSSASGGNGPVRIYGFPLRGGTSAGQSPRAAAPDRALCLDNEDYFDPAVPGASVELEQRRGVTHVQVKPGQHTLADIRVEGRADDEVVVETLTGSGRVRSASLTVAPVVPPGQGPPAVSRAAGGVYHYLFGAAADSWVRHAPAYATLSYDDLPSDADVTVYGDMRRLELSLLLDSKTRMEDVVLDFQEMRVSLGNDGLRIQDDCNRWWGSRPGFFSFAAGTITQLPADLRSPSVSSIGFTGNAQARVDASDRGLEFASYLGGGGDEQILDAAVDRNGYVYLAGETSSPNFSMLKPSRSASTRNIAAFVSRVRMVDGHHEYTTYFGGRSQDRVLGVALDGDDRVFVCGETRSGDFPAAEAGSEDSGWDGFVARLAPGGDGFDFCMRIGGLEDDRCTDIRVDDEGNLVVCGETRSGAEFRVGDVEAGIGAAHGGWDGFVLRLSGSDGSLARARRFGGPEDDTFRGIGVLPDGGVVAAGDTRSSLVTGVPAPAQAPRGQGDAVVAGFTAELEGRYTVLLGGRNQDALTDLAVDSAGRVRVCGRTASADFPVKAAWQPNHGGGKWDAFLAVLEGSNIVSSTVVGGSGMDLAQGLAIDPSGLVTVVGASTSTNFPVVHPVQPGHGGGVWDGFAIRAVGAFPLILQSTLIGGSSRDSLYAVAMDPGHGAVIAGGTASADMPSRLGVQRLHNGGVLDGWFSRFGGSVGLPTLQRVQAGGQPGGPGYEYFVGRYEVTNAEFVRFLNDAEVNRDNLRGAYMHVDRRGNVWMSPEAVQHEQELFTVWDSRIEYDLSRPVGARYLVSSRRPQTGLRYDDHPVTGVSWYGALKYCNWLTLEAGRGADARCYTEGMRPSEWHPVTVPADAWQQGVFTPAQRKALLELEGYRLPMDGVSGLRSLAGPFNEFYKVSAWNGLSNVFYGFGRNVARAGDANYLDHGALAITETTRVGYFDAGVAGHAKSMEAAPVSGNENVYGCSDLSGNVSEWLSDFGQTNAANTRACYGGSYLYVLPKNQDRFFVPPHFTDPFRGFRVATTHSEQSISLRIPLDVCICRNSLL